MHLTLNKHFQLSLAYSLEIIFFKVALKLLLFLLIVFFFYIFSVLSEPGRGSLPVIATVFDKLNHEYKKYLEAEQSYTMVNHVSCSSL